MVVKWLHHLAGLSKTEVGSLDGLHQHNINTEYKKKKKLVS